MNETVSRIRKRILLYLCTMSFAFLPILTQAQSGDAMHAPPLSPLIKLVGGVLVLFGMAVIVTALFYHGYRRRIHNRNSPTTPYLARGLRPILYGVLGMELVGALVLRSVGGSISEKSHERQLLRGNAQDAQIAVAQYMEKTPSDKQVSALLEFAEDSSPGLRYAAIDRLSTQVREGHEEVFEKAFRDSVGNVRERALEALTDRNPQRALPLLLAGIQDPDLTLRQTAVQRLSLLQIKQPNVLDKRIVPLIMRVLSEADTLDRATLTHVLSTLLGKPWIARTIDPKEAQERVLAQWKTWWQTAQPTWGTSEFDKIAPILPERSDPAPSLVTSDTEGQTFRLSTMQGRVVLLNFWGTWCAPCRAELPALKEVQRLYQGKPFDLIGVALNEPDEGEGFKKRLSELGVTYRQLFCNRTIQRDFGEITGVPVSVLVDKQGRVRYRWEGPRDLRTFTAAIDRLLAE